MEAEEKEEEEEEEGHNVSHHDPNLGFDALFIPRPTAHMLNCPCIIGIWFGCTWHIQIVIYIFNLVDFLFVQKKKNWLIYNTVSWQPHIV